MADKARLQDGNVIKFDYTLWVDGKMVETSDEAVAKANDIHRDSRRYQPLTVTLGGNQIIKGLESHIRSHGTVGKPVTVEIAAIDAYGERDAHKIKDVPMAQFKAQKVEPKVGMTLTFEGERGVITRVAGGRIRVDLNHDLAGKPLKYEYTIREVLTDEKAKVDAVLASLFPAGTYKVAFDADSVSLEVPDQAKFDQNWLMAKFRVVGDLRMATDKKRAVKLVEVYPAMPDAPVEEEGHEGHNH
ncbi:MAG: peptidylprolyl isomerase [bacterium]